MDDNRFAALMNDGGCLTKDEMREGWHFCPDLDYLLCKFGVQPVFRECLCKAWTDADIQEGS